MVTTLRFSTAGKTPLLTAPVAAVAKRALTWGSALTGRCPRCSCLSGTTAARETAAKPLVVRIPVGTRFVCNDTGDIFKVFGLDGEMYLACVGIRSGKCNNNFFKSCTNNWPDEFTVGTLGQTKYMYADV